MDHVLSTHLFVNHRLTSALLGRIQQAGIRAVEIFCARQHLDYRDKAQVAELGHWFRDSELKLHSLHSPMYNDEIWGRSGPHSVVTLTETVKGQRMQSVDEIKRAIETAEVIPFKYLIQHLGVANEEFDMRKFDAAFTALEELTHVGLNYAFDTGHANMAEGVEAAFDMMKERIRSTHVHDNNGTDDVHLFPLIAQGGSIDWKNTMKLLRSRATHFPLLLELKEKPEYTNPLESARLAFERLEAQ